ncbi:hypothetical protein [Vibrio breoganii]|uniref:Uncharacterized protein n=1 Tax=Vibrio breoganii TaxID=553239 RepID=A0ABX1U227_9VIBR|nr:hypothetical protein [Vibrio breoganii]NMO71949.1 hypothetical protein [Vibrio breoganii]NMR68487.1 hypothetical protein [Vibrio breoganii]PMG06945.1 hypothetical protein BCV02_00340 [Vibrio breoganii]PMG96471.1 hypothetical protein BCU79_06710 [Vibrio breoganii]PML87244.1 hypothetical protein BCT67_12120 [Vibrio breoganii]
MSALNTTATMEAKTGVILNLIQDLSAYRAGFCTLQDTGVRQHDVKLDFVAHLNITSITEVKKAITEAQNSRHPELDSGS